jgi:hypothetical protein
MNKRSSSKGKKYPNLVSENKALFKAVSVLPVGFKSSIPSIYIKSLPMIVGVVTILALFIIPTSRHSIVNFSQDSFSNFSHKNEELKSNLIFSLRTGLSAYSDQIRKTVKILPIDSVQKPQVYGGRVGSPELNRVVLIENLHSMTASLSWGVASK